MEEKVTPKQTGISLQIRYTNTKIPGIYKLLKGSVVIKQWAVNVDTKESGFERISLRDLDDILGGKSITLSAIGTFGEQIKKNRFGSEFTKWFFIIAIVFMICEMLLSREGLLSNIPGLKKLLKENE